VIQDLFFSGGFNYANHHNQRFPTFQDHNSIMLREVPVAMVMLVGTAVSTPTTS
jgi:hypothetical protein